MASPTKTESCRENPKWKGAIIRLEPNVANYNHWKTNRHRQAQLEILKIFTIALGIYIDLVK